MEGLVKAVGKATAPWWSATSYEDELDATDAAWVRNGKSDSLDSSEACSPRRRSFGDGPRPIPPLDEDPRKRGYEEEVKDASPSKKEARLVDVPPVHVPQRREPREVRRLWECATATAAAGDAF